METIDTISQVKKNWAPYRGWETEQRKKDKQNEELRKKNPPTAAELEHAKQYGRTVVDVINTMDMYSIDKSEDISMSAGVFKQLIGLGFVSVGMFLGTCATILFPLLSKKPSSASNVVGELSSKIGKLEKLKSVFKEMKEGRNCDYEIGSLVGALIGLIPALFIGNFYEAKIQKQASRVARFQTRENELKDYKNFVVYDNKQIEEARKIAQDLPEIEDKEKLDKKPGLIATVKTAKKAIDNLNTNYGEYDNWNKKYLAEEALKPEKFAQMKPSKEDLAYAQVQRDSLLGTIRKIENNSLDYAMNASMVIGAITFLLEVAGSAVGVGASSLIGLLQKKKVISESSKFFNRLKPLLVVFAPIAVALSFLGPLVNLSKNATRVGRFKAKQELLNNPEKFIVYDDEKRNSVSDVTVEEAPKRGFLKSIKSDVGALKQLKQDFKDYNNYMKTTRKQELKLKEALKQVDIVDSQREDAVKLQKNAFYAFEKMDEKSQRFIEDTDAVTDITQSTISSTLSRGGQIASLLILGKELKQYCGGKFPGILKSFDLLSKLSLPKKALVLGTFIIPSFSAFPLMFGAIEIKKKAGRIGVMQAMKDLDEPKNFIS